MALVLRRRPGASLILTTPEGQRIVLHVVGVDATGEVKLAIDAAREVEIVRAELPDPGR